MNILQEAAVWYAGENRWPVLPLHSIRNGACTCGTRDCSSSGKHPRTRSGLKDGTLDQATITRWWDQWPDSNVGVCTGAAAGIVVLDIDPRHGGDESLAGLEDEHGELPPTVASLTGGGGRHLVFSHPGGVIRNRANIRPGLDVRGDGGYIVAPPSLHASGQRYCWGEGYGPKDLSPVPMPSWLVTTLTQTTERDTKVTSSPAPAPDELNALLDSARRYASKARPVAEGGRNDAVFNLAGHVAAFEGENGLRLTGTQVLDLVREWNLKNSPPLPERELVQAVSSAMTNGSPRPVHRVAHPPTAAKKAARSPARVETYRPFPTEVLPEPTRSFVDKAAQAIGCDPSYVALPLLSALAAMIGNTRRIELKPGWSEPAIVWTAIVGESGTLKTPAFKLVMQPIRDIEARKHKEHDAALEQYEQEMQQYDAELACWKRQMPKNGAHIGDPPKKPKPPQAERLLVSDTTVEALAPILQANPRGVLLARDELAGWVGSFDRYAGGKGGADAAHWLSMHNSESITVDRKGGTPRTIYVPSASVSITGGIQPGILDRAIGREHRESGLLARLLLAMPPRRPKRWSEATVPESVLAAVAAVIAALYEFAPGQSASGDPCPHLLRLTPAGKAAWIEFFDAHAAEHTDLTGDLSAAWSKLEGYTARLTLVVHCVRVAAADPTLADPDLVDETSILAGVALSRWFGHETRRVYGVLAEDDDSRAHRQLVEWIERHGRSVTVRDVTHGLYEYRGRTEAAHADLDALVAAGLGAWMLPTPSPKGGRPARRFVLHPSSPITKTPSGGPAGEGSGDGETGDARLEIASDRTPPQTQGHDEVTGAPDNEDWGEL